MSMAAILKGALQAVSRTRAFDYGVSLMERRLSDDETLRVLMYHRVDLAGNRPHLWPGMIGPTPQEFARQVETLSSNYRVVSLDDVITAMRGNRKMPPRAVLITFDDAYRDFSEHAWPLLRKHGLPVTLFVATDYPDNNRRHFWWDRLFRALTRAPSDASCRLPAGVTCLKAANQRLAIFRRLKERLKLLPHAECMEVVENIVSDIGIPDADDNGVLSWQELADLHAQGVTLAPHTHTHPMLNRLPVESIREELSTSWNALVERFGTQIPKVVAYPAGGLNDDVVDVTRNLGFELAFSTQRGVNRLLTLDRFRIRRINVGARTTSGLLRAQLARSAG